MKLSALIESYTISYDFTKKKNSSSVIDFIKLNEVKIADIQKAMDHVKKSKEYQKLIDAGYVYKSSALQEKRATMYFESEDSNSQITCYATGQARRANRGGYNNSQFIASPIKTLPPMQWVDDSKAFEVLTTNLISSIKSVLQTFENKGKRAADGLSVVDERMKNLGFPEGFRIYIDSAMKNDKYIWMDEGQVMINAKGGGAIGNLVIDFGDNPELGPNVDFGTVEGIWKVVLKGTNIKSYKGLEQVFKPGMISLDIHTEAPNFKALSKIMGSNNIRKVYFYVDPRKIPLLSIPKICHEEVDIGKSADARLIRDTQITEIMEKLTDVVKNKMDALDFQDYLMDQGLDEAALQ